MMPKKPCRLEVHKAHKILQSQVAKIRYVAITHSLLPWGPRDGKRYVAIIDSSYAVM